MPNSFWFLLLALVAALLFSKGLLPWVLLFNGDREEALRAWKAAAPPRLFVRFPPRPVPELLPTDASEENLRLATDGYRRPVVIRGLYKNSTAVREWDSSSYLPKLFGDDVNIPVVQDGTVGTLQDDRLVEPFSTAFKRVYDSHFSKHYLFFPAKSRTTFKGVEKQDYEKLATRCDEIVKQELNLNEIRPGLGDPDDPNFVLTQFVIGKSPEDRSVLVTGSDFHCAGGNNWFVQVVGRKRWEFIMPEHSASLWPLKGGLYNFWTGNKDMASAAEHIPTEYVDLEPGDVLFNPPWQWHKITNYGGLTIGVPVRERNLWNTVTNNPYFFLIMTTNLLLDKFGMSLNGYPPPSASTEHDN